ncbi:MAG: D-alanine--D-alanine ligase [Firmicutes bacterium]|nr:D-alanine--D-alanine ligase [Bacillota bacterium]
MRIAVLCGGRSAERPVSLSSGRAVAEALRGKGHEVVVHDMDERTIPELAHQAVDLAFIALHGRMGEDGTVQGALETIGVPYVGSGVLASAVAMDKCLTKRLLSTYGIQVGRERVVRTGDPESWQEVAASALHELGTPVVVKPNREGSTFGLTLARTPEQVQDGLRLALSYDDTAIIEEYLRGMELTVAVVGEGHAPRTLGVIEIIPKNELYDYESKYEEGGSQHIIPARLPEAVLQRVDEVATRAYRALGCRDYARVDLIHTERGPVVLEVNTAPGMTATSLVPDAARESGLAFADFVEWLVTQAWQRAQAIGKTTARI